MTGCWQLGIIPLRPSPSRLHCSVTASIRPVSFYRRTNGCACHLVACSRRAATASHLGPPELFRLLRWPLETLGSNTIATTAHSRCYADLAAVPGAQGNGIVNSSFVQLSLPAGGASVSVRVDLTSAIFGSDNGSRARVRSAALRPRGSPAVTLLTGSAVSFTISSPGHCEYTWLRDIVPTSTVLTSREQ